ncbi:Iron-sulfur assembly protein 1 [Rhizophlyctis rosea]|nr:Iron-sulfur assembly protein 1 [Rhizophlyctis rosea]
MFESERLMREEEERLRRSEARRRNRAGAAAGKKKGKQQSQRPEPELTDEEEQHAREEFSRAQQAEAKARYEEERAREEEEARIAKERREQLKIKQHLRSRAFAAARDGQLELLKKLISEDVIPAGSEYIDKTLQSGKRALDETMLHIAARRNDEAMAKFLLDGGASTEHADWEGYTPIQVAVINSANDVATLLLDEYHCRLESKDKNGNTLLALAAQHGQVEMFDMLLGRGARVSTHDARGRTIRYKVNDASNNDLKQPEMRERLREIRRRIDAITDTGKIRKAKESQRHHEKEETGRPGVVDEELKKQHERLAAKIRKQNDDSMLMDLVKEMNPSSPTTNGPSRKGSAKKNRRKSSVDPTSSTRTAAAAGNPAGLGQSFDKPQQAAGQKEDKMPQLVPNSRRPADHGEDIDASLVEMIGMGFDAKRAASALSLTAGDLPRAVEYLLKGSSSHAARTSQTQKARGRTMLSTPQINSMLHGSYDPYSRNAAFWAQQGGLPQVRTPSPDPSNPPPLPRPDTSSLFPSEASTAKVADISTSTVFDVLADCSDEEAAKIAPRFKPVVTPTEQKKRSSTAERTTETISTKQSIPTVAPANRPSLPRRRSSRSRPKSAPQNKGAGAPVLPVPTSTVRPNQTTATPTTRKNVNYPRPDPIPFVYDAKDSIPRALPATAVGAAVRKASPSAKPRKAILTLTPAALTRLRTLTSGPTPQLLRIGTKKKGCSGQTYTLDYVSEPSRFDEIVEQDGVKVIVDSKALFSIIGSEMDYVEEKLKSEFVFRNPNVKETCGCGMSFMV